MQKKARFSVFILLGICMILSLPLNANAKEVNSGSNKKVSIINSMPSKSEPSLYECEIGIGAGGTGLSVEFITCCTEKASEIGCKDIVLQEKTLFGWKDISVKDHSELNTNVYGGGVVYIDAVKGKTYRAYCTHYAIVNGIEYTLFNMTDELVYN